MYVRIGTKLKLSINISIPAAAAFRWKYFHFHNSRDNNIAVVFVGSVVTEAVITPQPAGSLPRQCLNTRIGCAILLCTNLNYHYNYFVIITSSAPIIIAIK